MSNIVGKAGDVGKAVEAGQRSRHPLDTAAGVSRMGITWLSPLVKLARCRQIVEDDVWLPPSEHLPHKMAELFSKSWEMEFLTASQLARRPSLLRAIARAFWPSLLRAASLLLSFACSMLLQPFLIRELLIYLRSDSSDSIVLGTAYASAMLFCSAVSSFLICQFYLTSLNVGIQLKTAVTCVIFQKSMDLSAAARIGTSVGKTTNLMTVDTEKLYMACRFCNFVWMTPLMTIMVATLLALTVGPAAFGGISLIILLWPAQFIFAMLGSRARKHAMVFTDERVKFISEVIRGIRVAKLCAWERPIYRRAKETRRLEVIWLSTSLCLKAVTREGILQILPPATLALVFAIERARGVLVDETIALMALGFLNTLRYPFNLFAFSLAACQDALVSCDRISEFLQLPSVSRTLQPTDQNGGKGVVDVELIGAVFSWEEDVKPPPTSGVVHASLTENKFKLVVERLHLEGRGQRVAVLGRVASGKSSLLAALLGEMNLIQGSRKVRGRVAYMGQSPWIQNMSLRENIIFGHDFDEVKYQSAINAAALPPDLDVLKDGDLTEIGERGINLSGGQKARVGLARCLYAVAVQACDLLVLDCPFDALDVPTGERVFEGLAELGKHALLICGMSAQIHLLPEFDRIVVVEAGQVVAVSDFNDTVTAFPELAGTSATPYRSSITSASVSAEAGTDRSNLRVAKKQSTFVLMKSDTAKRGGVTVKTMLSHLGEVAKSGSRVGAFVASGLTIIFLVGQGCRVASDVLIVGWASDEFQSEWPFGFLSACAVFLAMRIVSTAFVSGRCSIGLHQRVLWHMLRAPVPDYFDTTTSGEIINKFAKDLEITDTILPETGSNFLSNGAQLCTIIVLSSYAIPWFLGVLSLLGGVFIMIGRQFSSVSRDLKRLDGSTRSPMYNSFSETLAGLETIRAWNVQDRFVNEFLRRTAHNLSFFHSVSMSEIWVMLRLESISFSIIGTFAFAAVGMRRSVEPKFIGLALVYAIQLTAMLQRTVQLAIMLNQQMTACERVRSFQDIQQELPWAAPADASLPVGWPFGGLVLKNVQLRYRQDELVLKGVSFTVSCGERVGICGRTGAGKSSLISALFRIVEPCGGSILLDGVDICTLGLHTLRSKLSIIPQEPVIFSGSLRSNLDPFNIAVSEDSLLDALQRVGLAGFADSTNSLNWSIAENGENLSQGQRQLLCIARVMIRPTKITALDEATSSMDAETDRAVQKALQDHWDNAKGDGTMTMLTVAHRLNTILNYDKILVLSFGKVVEFDTPAALQSRKDGEFSQMLHDAQSGTTAKGADTLWV